MGRGWRDCAQGAAYSRPNSRALLYMLLHAPSLVGFILRQGYANVPAHTLTLSHREELVGDGR